MATISEALKFPFGKFVRIFNVWWALIPIWGWLVTYGYMVSIYESIWAGSRTEVPAIRPFGRYGLGFYVLLLTIILSAILIAFQLIPFIGWILYLYGILVLPVMVLQYVESKQFKDGFDIGRASKVVFGNFGQYILVLLKGIVVGLVWMFASVFIITIPITLPAYYYGVTLLFADFYKEVTGSKAPVKAVKPKK